MPGKDTPYISKLRGGLRVTAVLEAMAFLFFFIIVYYFFKTWFVFLQCAHVLTVVISCLGIESNNVGTLYSIVVVYLIALGADCVSFILTVLEVQDGCGSVDCFGDFVLKYFVILMISLLGLFCLVQMAVYAILAAQVYKRDFKKKNY